MNFQCLEREIWIPSGFFVKRAGCRTIDVAISKFVKCLGMEDVVPALSEDTFLTSFPFSESVPVPFFCSIGFLVD